MSAQAFTSPSAGDQPLPNHVGTLEFAFDAAVGPRATQDVIGTPDRMLAAIRAELLSTLDAVIADLADNHEPVTVAHLDIDLGDFTNPPDWNALRLTLRDRVISALAPYLRPKRATAPEKPEISANLPTRPGRAPADDLRAPMSSVTGRDNPEGEKIRDALIVADTAALHALATKLSTTAGQQTGGYGTTTKELERLRTELLHIHGLTDTTQVSSPPDRGATGAPASGNPAQVTPPLPEVMDAALAALSPNELNSLAQCLNISVSQKGNRSGKATPSISTLRRKIRERLESDPALQQISGRRNNPSDHSAAMTNANHSLRKTRADQSLAPRDTAKDRSETSGDMAVLALTERLRGYLKAGQKTKAAEAPQPHSVEEQERDAASLAAQPVLPMHRIPDIEQATDDTVSNETTTDDLFDRILARLDTSSPSSPLSDNATPPPLNAKALRQQIDGRDDLTHLVAQLLSDADVDRVITSLVPGQATQLKQAIANLGTAADPAEARRYIAASLLQSSPVDVAAARAAAKTRGSQAPALLARLLQVMGHPLIDAVNAVIALDAQGDAPEADQTSINAQPTHHRPASPSNTATAENGPGHPPQTATDKALKVDKEKGDTPVTGTAAQTDPLNPAGKPANHPQIAPDQQNNGPHRQNVQPAQSPKHATSKAHAKTPPPDKAQRASTALPQPAKATNATDHARTTAQDTTPAATINDADTTGRQEMAPDNHRQAGDQTPAHQVQANDAPEQSRRGAQAGPSSDETTKDQQGGQQTNPYASAADGPKPDRTAKIRQQPDGSVTSSADGHAEPASSKAGTKSKTTGAHPDSKRNTTGRHPEQTDHGTKPTLMRTDPDQTQRRVAAERQLAAVFKALDGQNNRTLLDLLETIWSTMTTSPNTDTTPRSTFWQNAIASAMSQSGQGDPIQAVAVFLQMHIPDTDQRVRAIRTGIARLTYAAGMGAQAQNDLARDVLQSVLDLATAGPPAPAPSEPAPAAGLRLHTEQAGLVLFHPYLTMLFERLDILDDKNTIPQGNLTMAAAILDQLATGETSAHPEPDPLHNCLLGVPDHTKLDGAGPLSGAAKALIESLIQSVIAQWARLGNTSPDGLRAAFIRRGGILQPQDTEQRRLTVDDGPYDMLLDSLPWPVNLIALPWMPAPLHVDWRGTND